MRDDTPGFIVAYMRVMNPNYDRCQEAAHPNPGDSDFVREQVVPCGREGEGGL